MKKISFIFGTRPEAIKLAPVILELKKRPEFECHVCITAQHRTMLDQVLAVFGVVPDIDLNLMQPDQTLAALTASAVTSLTAYLKDYKPDLVLVQGDTTTVFCAALAAFYNKVPVGHVEAGLRTGNRYSPFPEEINRVLTTHLADYHFAPTESSRRNLEREGVQAERIQVTGNTVIDALLIAMKEIAVHPPPIRLLPDFLQPGTENSDPRMILITGHRRENFGAGFKGICNGILDLAKEFPGVHFVYPVHLNPNVQKTVHRLIGGAELKNIHLIEPLPYLHLVGLMSRAYLIMTDSGGIQEEAPTLGKPVLVLRNTTERPEGIDLGLAKLVGTNRVRIFNEAARLLNDRQAYDEMAHQQNPYGDGHASARIADYLAVCGVPPAYKNKG